MVSCTLLDGKASESEISQGCDVCVSVCQPVLAACEFTSSWLCVGLTHCFVFSVVMEPDSDNESPSSLCLHGAQPTTIKHDFRQTTLPASLLAVSAKHGHVIVGVDKSLKIFPTNAAFPSVEKVKIEERLEIQGVRVVPAPFHITHVATSPSGSMIACAGSDSVVVNHLSTILAVRFIILFELCSNGLIALLNRGCSGHLGLQAARVEVCGRPPRYVH